MNGEGRKRFAVVGAGFIGKAVIRNLLLKNHDVSVLDRNTCPVEFLNKVTWITADFQNEDALARALYGATAAYHLVSSTVPGDQHVDVALELNENVVGSLRFTAACEAAGVTRIVFASSSSVYGLQEHFPIAESAPTNPISAHGIHKLTVEKFLLLARHSRGVEIRIFRISNPYGPEQSLVGRQGFIAIAIGCIIREVPLILRDEGRSIRDFIYVDDVAEALVLGGLIQDLPSIMNIATGKGHSLRCVVDMLGKILQREINTITAESRIVDIPTSILSTELARSAMGFTASTTLHDGLVKTLRHHGLPTYGDYINTDAR